MFFLAFLALLGMAIALGWLGNRLVPLAMPRGRVKTLGAGLAGGLAGGLLLGIGPQVAGLHLPGAGMGAALAILLLGIAPFLKILLGRT